MPTTSEPAAEAGELTLAGLEDVAWRRRSNLRVDPDRPVPAELLDRLCRLASWAPNHHRTAPWRFCAVTGDGRHAIGEALAEDLLEAGEDHAAKIAKARTKYTRAPVVLVVASAAGSDPVTTAENRDAVAAAVQTLLLGATAAGLATLWSTGAAARSRRIIELCGFSGDDTLVGLVYLGWPVSEPTAPAERPAPAVAHLDHDPRAAR
ncbi:MAG: nitroreductase [Acidimicrobiales bacterium]|jgi:nitroreductase|nr:nitroreductase [Acidimicrobiales bacterium]